MPDCLYELHPEWEKEFRKVPGGAHEELLMIVTAIRQDTVNQLDPDNDDYYDDDFIDTQAWAYYEPELLPLFRNMDDVLLEEILEKIKETQLNNSPQLVAQKTSTLNTPKTLVFTGVYDDLVEGGGLSVCEEKKKIHRQIQSFSHAHATVTNYTLIDPYRTEAFPCRAEKDFIGKETPETQQGLRQSLHIQTTDE